MNGLSPVLHAWNKESETNRPCHPWTAVLKNYWRGCRFRKCLHCSLCTPSLERLHDGKSELFQQFNSLLTEMDVTQWQISPLNICPLLLKLIPNVLWKTSYCTALIVTLCSNSKRKTVLTSIKVKTNLKCAEIEDNFIKFADTDSWRHHRWGVIPVILLWRQLEVCLMSPCAVGAL